MNPNEVKAERVRKGYSQEEMATKLNISLSSYRNKEFGTSKFTEDEKFSLVEILCLGFEQMDRILYDGRFKKHFPLLRETSER